MKKWAGRVFWGLVWGFVLWYAGGSVAAHREAMGADRGTQSGKPAPLRQELGRADCRVMEEYLRHKGFEVRVESGVKAIRPWGVMVWLQVKLPTGEVIAWPEFFGPYDHSRTLAGDWPRE